MTNRLRPARASHFTPGRRLELLLTLAVATLLFQVAAPLAAAGADLGLQQRYGPLDTPMSADWLLAVFRKYAWSTMPQDLRAVAVLRTAGHWLALLGGVGWLALQLVRIGTGWAAGLALLLWAALAWLLRPFQLPGVFWASCVALALAGTLLMLVLLGTRQRHDKPRTSRVNTWTACIWPGWLILTGAGCLVTLDFAARGPVLAYAMASLPLKPGARYLGLNQVDGLWLASGLMFAGTFLRGSIVRALVGVLLHPGRPVAASRGPLVLLVLAGASSLGLGWLGAAEHRAFLGISGLQGGGRPHVSGEVLRLGVCTVLAWFAYRVGEWRVSLRRARDGLRHLLIALALCTLGLVLSDDKGPLLVLALAVALLLGAPLLQFVIGWHSQGWERGARHGAALVVAVALAISALGIWRTTLIDWLPRVSTDAAVREVLRANPFEARSPNLAQARWLMDATPSWRASAWRVSPIAVRSPMPARPRAHWAAARRCRCRPTLPSFRCSRPGERRARRCWCWEPCSGCLRCPPGCWLHAGQAARETRPTRSACCRSGSSRYRQWSPRPRPWSAWGPPWDGPR